MMVFHSLKYHGVASDQKFKIFGSILNIDNVKTVEKDEYTCNAINSVGMDSKKVKLLVNETQKKMHEERKKKAASLVVKLKNTDNASGGPRAKRVNTKKLVATRRPNTKILKGQLQIYIQNRFRLYGRE
ncbi:uncharacterized protein LOC136085869 isoform X2 [Hydra vulgaris]